MTTMIRFWNERYEDHMLNEGYKVYVLEMKMITCDRVKLSLIHQGVT